jgi:hypothetical protein
MKRTRWLVSDTSFSLASIWNSLVLSWAQPRSFSDLSNKASFSMSEEGRVLKKTVSARQDKGMVNKVSFSMCGNGRGQKALF